MEEVQVWRENRKNLLKNLKKKVIEILTKQEDQIVNEFF